MVDRTVFDFTLPNGKRSSIWFAGDYADEYDLKKGALVRVFPSDDSFKLGLDAVPLFLDFVMCRIMSMDTQVLCSPIWDNIPYEVRFFYLASDEVTSQYH